MKLVPLDMSGTYDEQRRERMRQTRVEEVLEIGGRYHARDGVDDGYYFDEDGRERELPDDWRMEVRVLEGQLLIVVKGSIWNGASRTYDGVHDTMDAGEIRQAIEGAIERRG